MKRIEVAKAFATEEQCLAYLEAKRWPDGVRCLTCSCRDVSRITRKVTRTTDNKRAQLYQCLKPSCKAQFSATSGTIFNGSHLSLDKWYLAIALMVDSKKGMSAMQLQRHLKVNYRTAWYLAHRIREAMLHPDGLKPTRKWKLTQPTSEVSIRATGASSRNNKCGTLYEAMAKKVDAKGTKASTTDDAGACNFRLTRFHNIPHSRIHHSRGEYVKGEVHTNTVENSFSLPKRAAIGTYHQLSIRHLQAVGVEPTGAVFVDRQQVFSL
jgi:transposase-like protein